MPPDNFEKLNGAWLNLQLYKNLGREKYFGMEIALATS